MIEESEQTDALEQAAAPGELGLPAAVEAAEAAEAAESRAEEPPSDEAPPVDAAPQPEAAALPAEPEPPTVPHDLDPALDPDPAPDGVSRRRLRAQALVERAALWLRPLVSFAQSPRRVLMALLGCLTALAAAAALSAFCGVYVYGVAWGGVDSVVPRYIRAESLARIESRLSREDAALVEGAYSDPSPSGVRSFSGSPAQLSPRSRLSRALLHAEALLQLEAEGRIPQDSSRVPAQGQLAAAYVLSEYGALGHDLGALQRRRILSGLGEGVLAGACALALLVAFEWMQEHPDFPSSGTGAAGPPQDGDSLKDLTAAASAPLTLLD